MLPSASLRFAIEFRFSRFDYRYRRHFRFTCLPDDID